MCKCVCLLDGVKDDQEYSIQVPPRQHGSILVCVSVHECVYVCEIVCIVECVCV